MCFWGESACVEPKFVYLIPTLDNRSRAMLSLGRRKKMLELAVKYHTHRGRRLLPQPAFRQPAAA